ncbi:hypothetical protein [Flavobacterium sp. WC2430]|uniref:hypothetical protein n=1 Tax=Flavobacterium sp. WC2430 TaxID=3234137 RepID=UPI0034653E49
MKIIYTIALVLLLISCNNKEDKKKSIPLNIKHQPLFLTLSPYMSDAIFLSEVQKLNKDHKLENNQFALPIDSRYYYFDVSKDKHSIYLSYTVKKGYSKKNLNYKISDEILAAYKKQTFELKNLFDKKYPKTIKQIPNIEIENFGLYNMKYTLYEEEDKYILLRYRVHGSRVGSEVENDQKMDDFLYKTTGKRVNRDDLEEKQMKKYLKAAYPSPSSADFGFEFNINYFYKKYIDSLIVDMKIKNKELEKYNLDLQKEKNRIDDIRSKNINEI